MINVFATSHFRILTCFLDLPCNIPVNLITKLSALKMTRQKYKIAYLIKKTGNVDY